MSEEERARKLLDEAEYKAIRARSSGGFFRLFGGTKSVDLVDLYTKAGNLYKVAKNWNEAGKCFFKCAEIHSKDSDSKHDAASNYVEAANCYRKGMPNEAIKCLFKACEIYTDMGRFSMAARHHTTIAEIYETDPSEAPMAMFHYQKAADYHIGEESRAAANKCLLKVAHLAVQQDKYNEAIGIFEEVGASSAESTLLKYSAKEYFFKAALCHMGIDAINAENAVKRYEKEYPSLADSREFKLLHELLTSIEEQDADGYEKTLQEYDRVSRLDPWMVALMLKIKKSIEWNSEDLC